MDSPPAQTSSQLPPPPRAQGCGCCAAGCGTLLIIAIAGLALLLGVTWYLYSKAIDSVTASQPTTIQLEQPSEEQFAVASGKLEQVRNAANAKQAVTVEFTAADLNALIARHPSFEDLRGKMRVGIAQSIMTLDLSVPMSGVPLPKFKRRWFNGKATFGFSYDEDGFSFSPRSLEANGHTIAEELFGDAAPTINNYFDREYGADEASESDTEEERVWRQIRSLSVVDDKVVVTTKGGETT